MEGELHAACGPTGHGAAATPAYVALMLGHSNSARITTGLDEKARDNNGAPCASWKSPPLAAAEHAERPAGHAEQPAEHAEEPAEHAEEPAEWGEWGFATKRVRNMEFVMRSHVA